MYLKSKLMKDGSRKYLISPNQACWESSSGCSSGCMAGCTSCEGCLSDCTGSCQGDASYANEA